MDDNRDMLDFLEGILLSDYEVKRAENAEEALAVCAADIPDIIVSDVMMPGIDGMELCRRIKNDINVSHVPVILLTAKVENVDYVTGFDSGADLYVTKPFSTDVLKAQIKGLLANRARLRERLAANPSMVVSSDVISEVVPESNIEKEFFERMQRVIEDRMSDNTFTVDVLAKELAISRTGLFTKLKTLVGVTPNEYIRMIRLRKAAELLKSTNLRINEVCWQVGFSSRSHFSKCFQEQYGMSPSEYKGS